MGQISSPFQSSLSAMHTRFPAHKEGTKGRENKFEPTLYEKDPSLQEGLNCASLRDPKRLKAVVDKNTSWNNQKPVELTSQEYNRVANPARLYEDYTDLIDHHVQFRVALFFQQAVACYNTPFHFEISKTEGQFFEAPSLKVKNKDTKAEKSIRYEAAHSGTIPGLKACLRSELQPGQSPHYFTYLKSSQMEVMHNSTNGLPDFVNKIDTLIDGKAATKDGLRKSTIALINRVALGALTPVDATRKFLANFEHSLAERPKKSKTLTPAKRKVIDQYRSAVQDMRKNAAKPLDAVGVHSFFDHLLDVNVSKETQEDSAQIRQIVYRRKYELIRESFFAEAQVQNIIDQRLPRNTPEEKHLIRAAILHHAGSDTELRQTLEKLFCISYEGLKKNAATLKQINGAITLGKKPTFDAVLRDIRAAVSNFRRMEHAFQAMLIRDLRVNLRGWKQTELSAAITAKIGEKILKQQQKPRPNWDKIRGLQAIPRSQATISRLENSRIHIQKQFATPENQRRKPLTMHYAKVLSKALGVEHGHFFSSFFASEAV